MQLSSSGSEETGAAYS